MAQEFEPLRIEGSNTLEPAIYFQQISRETFENLGREIGSSRTLLVDIPPDEIDVLVGAIKPGFFSQVTVAASWGFLVLLGLFAFTVLLQIWRGRISLEFLISEADGKASLARFQALIFTFVFMIAVLLILVETGGFPNEVPNEMLYILAGSLTTYLVAKGIQGTSGRGGVAGSGAVTAAHGPILRFSGSGSTDFEPANIVAGSGPLLLDIATSARGPNRFTPVAVAVGAVPLTISYEEPQGGLSEANVQYVNVRGEQVSETLHDSKIISTPPGRITEVSVRFKSNAETGIVRLTVSA